MTVYTDDDEAAGIWAKDVGLTAESHRAVRRGREFLAGQCAEPGAGRRVRAVQRDLFSSGRGQVGRDLEPGVHAVQPRGRSAEQLAAAAVEEHRHGHGPGADGRDAAGRADELSHRHPAADRAGGGRSVRHEVRVRIGQRPAAAADHRSRAGLHVRGARERVSRARTRRSTSSSGCCGGRCSTGTRWGCASRSCTSSCRWWPR